MGKGKGKQYHSTQRTTMQYKHLYIKFIVHEITADKLPTLI